MTADTPLKLAITARIRNEGPLTVRTFMDLALNDPEHGYYRTRSAIGAEGDFITAPEISQVFGEIVGLWSAVVWQAMGSPQRVRLIEIGPGRGTLMADALRAIAKVPSYAAALEVHLVESNRTLASIQKERFSGAVLPFAWHESFQSLARGEVLPSIVIANEFLDTCPARQIVKTDEGWVDRCVCLDRAGALTFIDGSGETALKADAGPAGAKPGEIFEVQDFSFLDHLGRLRGRTPLAGLFFDYGHMRSAVGDTLQALKRHKPEHPLASPGEADLTVHVDFEAFGRAAQTRGFSIDGPLPQGEFLGRLGIIERASRLMAANPKMASEIELQIGRIMSPNGMGSRFKAISLRDGLSSPLPGF